MLKYKGWLVTDTIKIQQNNFIEMLFTGRDHTTESCANLFLFSSSFETILKREAFKKRASIGEAINAVQGNVVRLVDTLSHNRACGEDWGPSKHHVITRHWTMLSFVEIRNGFMAWNIVIFCSTKMKAMWHNFLVALIVVCGGIMKERYENSYELNDNLNCPRMTGMNERKLQCQWLIKKKKEKV